MKRTKQQPCKKKKQLSETYMQRHKLQQVTIGQGEDIPQEDGADNSNELLENYYEDEDDAKEGHIEETLKPKIEPDTNEEEQKEDTFEDEKADKEKISAEEKKGPIKSK